MIKIKQYEEHDRDEIIRLVLHCQNDGTRPPVGVEDQPELLHIQDKYIISGGNFWVAKDDHRIIGSIGLMNLGNGIGVLKKFFVYEEFRSAPHHLGQRLYNELFSFIKEHYFTQILLDTPKNSNRAHNFYEKSGFKKILQEQLPIQFDHPYKNCDFFILKVK